MHCSFSKLSGGSKGADMKTFTALHNRAWAHSEITIEPVTFYCEQNPNIFQYEEG